MKQGDTLSAILFNCVLDIAFDGWRLSLNEEGLFIAYGLPRITNTRYADDMLLYAKSLGDPTCMTKGLMESLQKHKLTMNAKKTKILQCNPSEEEPAINFIKVG